MVVSVSDVRTALNDISTASLSDNTITQKIEDATRVLNGFDLTGIDQTYIDAAIRDIAAWKGFIISREYESAKMADLSYKQNIKLKVEELRKTAEESLMSSVGSQASICIVTEMLDDSTFPEIS